MRFWTFVAAAAVLIVACSSNKSTQRDDDGACIGAACSQVADAGAALDTSALPDLCTGGTSWSSGTQVFRDATAERGLLALSAHGVRISTVDFDGDGYADLSIRKTGSASDDFVAGRVTWLLRNNGDGSFEDVTKSSAIVRSRFSGDENVGRPAEVFAFADIDNDGDLDAVTAFSNDGSSPEGTEIMTNDGNGRFSFGPLDTPFRRAGSKTSVGALTWVDVNRDGRVDLWVGQGAVDGALQSDRLFVQQQDGSFVDVTAAAGLETQPWTTSSLSAGRGHSNAWSTAACDLDGDGDAELLAASYGRAPNKLFQARHDGQTLIFGDVAVSSGYAFDNRQDWSDNESARCWCTLNPDSEDCAGISPPTRIRCDSNTDAFRWSHGNDREPWRLGGNSGTTVCGDIDNDGDLDLLTTEIVHWDVGSSSDPSELLFNDGNSPPVFARPGNEVTGLTRMHIPSWNDGDITAAMFDFDNDGRLDVYVGSTDYGGTRALLYHQKPDGTFDEVPISDGIDHTSAHGVAVADYDRDGDLDLVIGHSRSRCSTGDHCYESGHARFYENTIGQAGNWFQLSLQGGEGTNRSAIGARVTVETADLTQTQEVGGGHGHYGVQHDLTLHFGLGAACVASVKVRWPNGDLTEQTFDVQSGYRYLVAQAKVPVALIDP